MEDLIKELETAIKELQMANKQYEALILKALKRILTLTLAVPYQTATLTTDVNIEEILPGEP